MTIEELKEHIKNKELRMNQLRSMDTNKLSAEDRELIKSLEQDGTAKEKTGRRVSIHYIYDHLLNYQ